MDVWRNIYLDCFGEVEFWEISVAAMLTSGVAER